MYEQDQLNNVKVVILWKTTLYNYTNVVDVYVYTIVVYNVNAKITNNINPNV